MDETTNPSRYKLHLMRALLQAHLDVIDEAISQYNRSLCENDLMNSNFRNRDEKLYERLLSIIEGIE